MGMRAWQFLFNVPSVQERLQRTRRQLVDPSLWFEHLQTDSAPPILGESEWNQNQPGYKGYPFWPLKIEEWFFPLDARDAVPVNKMPSWKPPTIERTFGEQAIWKEAKRVAINSHQNISFTPKETKNQFASVLLTCLTRIILRSVLQTCFTPCC